MLYPVELLNILIVFTRHQHYIGNQKANIITNYQILRVLHLQTLDVHNTNILRLINVIFYRQLVLVMFKKHVKFHNKKSIGPCVSSTSKLMEIIKRFARAKHKKLISRVCLISLLNLHSS